VIFPVATVKPAHASGNLVTPPSLQYYVSWWYSYINTGSGINPNFVYDPVKPISCSAPSIAELAPCVASVAGFSVSYSSYWGNYRGGSNLINRWGYTDVVVSHMGCPAHAQSNGTSTCTCTDPYAPDSAGTSCVSAATCPVDKLTTPPFGDACSTSLEKGKGVDVDNACGTLREPDMVEAASCIAAKIHALNIPYTQPSATIRTTAYQDHLLEIWTKSQQLDTIMNSVVYLPAVKQACAPRNVEINNEKAAHGITHQPSSSGDAAPHVEHRAIDIPEAVIKALKKQVTTYTTTVTIINGKKRITRTIASDVDDYMHSVPNACDANLSWGGRFNPVDPVHFQLPKNQGDTP
jgi:hypothetical protein